MEFVCPYLGCKHYLGWISFPPCTLHMACVVSTLHIADTSREAAELLSFVSLINDADTEQTQHTIRLF